MSITTFAEATAALRPFWGDGKPHPQLSLNNMRELLAAVGNPQDTLQVVHVAGTSGKSSTAYYIAALLQAAGKQVGLTVSPHVVSVNERVQINGQPLPEAVFCSALESFLSLVAAADVHPTYFELLTALALWYFARTNVDYAVVEVGVGGMLDPTNIFTQPDKVCVITDIGLDHTDLLGKDLQSIAAHKAGIIQLHNVVFSYVPQDPAVASVITKTAQQKQADLHFLQRPPAQAHKVTLPFYQRRNFGLALETVQFVLERDDKAQLTKQQIDDAANITIPGRMEILHIIGKTVILDGAHNAPKLQALAESVRVGYPGKTIAVLAAVRAGKQSLAPAIAQLAHSLVATSFTRGPEMPYASVPAATLAAECQKQGVGATVTEPDAQAALTRLLQCNEDILLITGSFYLVGMLRPLLVHSA